MLRRKSAEFKINLKLWFRLKARQFMRYGRFKTLTILQEIAETV